MLHALRRRLALHAKAALRDGWRPILLPHYAIVDGGLSALGQPPRPITGALRAAFALCDGSRTLTEVSRESGLSRTELIAEASATGPLLLWPSAIPPAPAADDAADVVILSPHFDDAPLSLGGRMLQWGHRCLVWDLYSVVSWWRFKIASHEDPLIQQTRESEERLIARLTGVSLRTLGLMEAPRRGYPLGTIFTAAVRDDEQAGHAIRAAVADFARARQCDWFLPLGVGNHVDHRIARDAALAALLGDAGVPPDRIRFYEDLPYAAQSPGVHDFRAFVPGRRLRLAEQTPISPLRKRALLRAYWSQLTPQDIHRVGAYALRFGRQPVERVWAMSVSSTPAPPAR